MTESRRVFNVDRLAGLSDAVLAIVLTLLVLDLLPDAPQDFEAVVSEWPSYVAYLVAFVTIATVWLDHNDLVSRVRRVDAVALVLNLAMLLGASLVPWPTALLARALQAESTDAGVAAVVVYAVVTVLIGMSWFALDQYLCAHPALLQSPRDAERLRHHARAGTGSLAVAVLAIALSLISPLASLALFLFAPVTFVTVRLLRGEPELTPDDTHPPITTAP